MVFLFLRFYFEKNVFKKIVFGIKGEVHFSLIFVPYITQKKLFTKSMAIEYSLLLIFKNIESLNLYKN